MTTPYKRNWVAERAYLRRTSTSLGKILDEVSPGRQVTIKQLARLWRIQLRLYERAANIERVQSDNF